MKIVGGIDTDFGGEAWAADGIRVGYLPQEPVLDERKNVEGNIQLRLVKPRIYSIDLAK